MSFFRSNSSCHKGDSSSSFLDSEEDDIPLRTARASACVKAKRGGELFVKVYSIVKQGGELEMKKSRMKFAMDCLGKELREAAVNKLALQRPEKLVPFFVSGGVFMDLSRTVDQYVMGVTEKIELKRYKHPRGKVLVILYELGKIESVDVWSGTTIRGVLMAIVAKNETTVNECILCTAEPVTELSLDYVLPKRLTKLVFLKRSRVHDNVPDRPLFPSRSYLEEMAARTMVNTMWTPPPSLKPPKKASKPTSHTTSTTASLTHKTSGSGWTRAVASQSPEEDSSELLSNASTYSRSHSRTSNSSSKPPSSRPSPTNSTSNSPLQSPKHRSSKHSHAHKSKRSSKHSSLSTKPTKSETDDDPVTSSPGPTKGNREKEKVKSVEIDLSAFDGKVPGRQRTSTYLPDGIVLSETVDSDSSSSIYPPVSPTTSSSTPPLSPLGGGESSDRGRRGSASGPSKRRSITVTSSGTYSGSGGGSAPPPAVSQNASPSVPVKRSAAAPTPKPLDVVSDINSSENKYERLVFYLDHVPVPQPRKCAALFKDWFSHDPNFKAYFTALGVQRNADLLKILSNSLTS
eukprot:TRINITY_DN10794_c0_g1_i1.p1 TRINITY_DN10794_c0_g1~~TRINITY_DN10794_c0_g1_i1.p1  ORF type:complete len:574 (+),score=106.56 TRINITY_DN10794_c0_g1_i1:85-1806(+)